MANEPSVILLPGIMGSRLYFPASGMFWDPDSVIRMLDWVPAPLIRSSDYLKNLVHVREAAGVLVDPVAVTARDHQVRRGWGTVAWSFYGDFLSDLEKEYDRPIHAIGYDWRQSLRRLGLYVSEKMRRIQETEGTRRFVIVTHSMGGLVARSAFAVAPELKNRVSGIVYVCQPAVGAVTMYRRMFTGLTSEFDGTPDGGISEKLFDRIFSLILGGDRADFLAKISGMPGAVSLLPSDYFPIDASASPWLPELTGTNSATSTYRSRNSPPGLMPTGRHGLSALAKADLKARIDEFHRMQDFLGPPDSPQTVHPDTWVVYGTGRDTETHISRQGARFMPSKTKEGDGTVPVASATAIPVKAGREIAIQGLEHSQPFSNKTPEGRTCVRKVIGLVKEIAPDDRI